MENLIDFYWEQYWKGKDRRDIVEYFKDNVITSPPLTVTGPLDFTSSRHLIDPARSFQDDYVRETNWLMGTRCGKTLIIDGVTMWVPDCRPGPTLLVYQDDEAAKDQAELRFWIMIEKCEDVKRLLSSDRHASRTCQINFPHMPMHFTGPAFSNLQSRGWQNVVLDECHCFRDGTIEEARARLGDYVKMGTDKFVCLSQGGVDGGEWWQQYSKGLIHTWNVQCMSCGHYQYPTWTGRRADGSRWGMMFDEHKDDFGFWIPERVIPTTRFQCEKCNYVHTWSVRTKTEWNRTGQYVVEDNKDKIGKKKSFTCPSTIDYPWDQLVDLYLHAMNECKRGNPLPLIQFFQKRMAQFSSEKTVMEGSANLARSSYSFTSEWAAEDDRGLAFDVQQTHIWVQARAFSNGRKPSETDPKGTPKGESRRLCFRKVYSLSEVEAIREEFKIQPNHVLGDARFRRDEVMAACVRYGWVGTMGVERERYFFHDLEEGKVRKSYSEPQPFDPECGTSNQDTNVAWIIYFSADIIADRLDGLISNSLYLDPVQTEDDSTEKEYRIQMSAEWVKIFTDTKSHKITKKRVCPSHNNHAYDLAKILTLMQILLGIIPDPYDEKEIKKLTPAK